MSYRTVVTPVRAEIPKIKGSRFIADLAPIRTPGDADAVLHRVRTELPDARHYCWAWRRGRHGDELRYSDDGEPSGTAGRPILQHLEGAGVTNAILVVTRYFGGTKLGAGGLVRAYGGAAAVVLAAADVREIVVTRRIVVRHPYDDTAAVKAVMAAHDRSPTDAGYGEHVRLVFDVPEAEVAPFVEALRDRTAGRADIRVHDADPD